MFFYHCLNPISEMGLNSFTGDYARTQEIQQADALLVRSASMHEMEIPPQVKAVARAGAGVNNIPLETCSEQGIVVFNTPGANANGVKEMVIGELNGSSSRKQMKISANWQKNRKSSLPAVRSKENVWV